MVLIDAIHEDGYVVYGWRAHHLRDQGQGRIEIAPRIARDEATLREAQELPTVPLDELRAPLDRMPATAKQTWQWAARQPVYRIAQPLEMEWSPDEAERVYQQRRDNPTALGTIPLVVLARTNGEYRDGMNIPASTLEKLRRAQQADLAKLSRNGTLLFAPKSGHNIHLEDPSFTVRAIRGVVDRVRNGR